MDLLDNLSDNSGASGAESDALDFLSEGSSAEDCIAASDQPRVAQPDLRLNFRHDLLDDLRRLPWGPDRKYLQRRLKRERARGQQDQEQAEAERKAIAGVWSRTCLGRGERLADGQRGTKRRKGQHQGQKVWQHSRAWTLTGTLRVAFSSIGALLQDASGMRQTRCELDAIAAVAISHRRHVDGRAAATKFYMWSHAASMADDRESIRCNPCEGSLWTVAYIACACRSLLLAQ